MGSDAQLAANKAKWPNWLNIVQAIKTLVN